LCRITSIDPLAKTAVLSYNNAALLVNIALMPQSTGANNASAGGGSAFSSAVLAQADVEHQQAPLVVDSLYFLHGTLEPAIPGVRLSRLRNKTHVTNTLANSTKGVISRQYKRI